MDISFNVSHADSEAIDAIVERAAGIAKEHGVKRFDRLSCRMDLVAVHANTCRLDLDRLLAADDFNLIHDVFGINRHIDRSDAKLLDCFRPRFAHREHVAA